MKIRRLLWIAVLLLCIPYAGALIFLEANESELVFRTSVSHGETIAR